MKRAIRASAYTLINVCVYVSFGVGKGLGVLISGVETLYMYIHTYTKKMPCGVGKGVLFREVFSFQGSAIYIYMYRSSTVKSKGKRESV